VNPISRIIGSAVHGNDTTGNTGAMTPEELEAKNKADRIAWHKANATTGPFKMSHLSAGRYASRVARSEVNEKTKMNRRRRKAFLAEQNYTATLRGHLKAAGVLPGVDGEAREANDAALANIYTSLIVRYAPRDEENQTILHDDVLTETLELALADYQARVA
jgi:hypothetical protein